LVAEVIEKLTTFGDAGALLPDMFVLIGPRILDYSGLINQAQIWLYLITNLLKFQIPKI
jgi:hypothetical protein